METRGEKAGVAFDGNTFTFQLRFRIIKTVDQNSNIVYILCHETTRLNISWIVSIVAAGGIDT